MNRRELIERSIMAMVCGSLSGGASMPALMADTKSKTTGVADPSLQKLRHPYDPRFADQSYKLTLEAGGPPKIPNTLLFYDEGENKFKSPKQLQTEKAKGGYVLTTKLRSFNIKSTLFDGMSNDKSDVQIGLNFTAPVTSRGDKFAWIAKNAVNIFMQKAGDVPKTLSSFKASNPEPGSQTPTNKIEVLQGRFDMQVNAFFQKKDGFWRKLFQALAGAPGSPLLATLGIPGIALEALDFVSFSISKLTQDEQLQPIWDTNPISFALTQDITDERFKFKPGLWVAVDSDVAKQKKQLEGYTVELDNETFTIQDKDGKQLDATYLVADFAAES